MDLLKLHFERARVMQILLKTQLRSFLTTSEENQSEVVDFVCPVEEWVKARLISDLSNRAVLIQLRDAYAETHELINELNNNGHSGKHSMLPVVESVLEQLQLSLTVVEQVFGQILLDEEDSPQEVTISKEELSALYQAILKLDQYAVKQEIDSKIAFKAAEENAVKFKDSVRQAPVGMVILRGREMVVEMANHAYLSLVDRRERDFVGRTLFDSLPEVEEKIGGILTRVFDTGIPYYGNEFEIFLNRHGQTERCYFNFVYQPFKSADTIIGIIVIANEVTVQVKAKKSLEQREYQFRNLVTQSQFAKAIFKGEDFVISMANESMVKNLWRRDSKDVEGYKLLDVFPELADQEFPDLLRKVYASGEIHRENEAVVYIDGPGGMKKHYLDFQYAPMFEIDGSVSAIMVSANDVTEKVELRRQFEEIAERLSLATEGTNLATWDLNMQTWQVIYTPRLVEIFGVENDRVLTYASMREMIQPDDRKNIVEKAFEVALKTGFYNYEARVVRPDKAIRWIRVQGKVIFDENHVPLRMLGTMMDITEQIEAEFALRASEQKFRLLSDSMPQLVWTGDPEGHINYFNHAVYEYTGLSWNELANDGWFKIVHPDDRVDNLLQWREAVRLGREFLFEHRFRRYDGEYRWQLSRATPQKNSDGVVEMWVGTSTDIHDRKMFISELEFKVQQRTKELTRMNHELIKTNLELGQFAYVASHDLQEPLRKIQMLSTRIFELEADSFSDKGRDYLQRLQGASVRMQQLVTDLLAFSRANVIEKHFEETDLNQVLAVVEEQLSELIQQTGAVIVSDKLPVLKIIVYQFEQLFTNLITNSLKFVKPGHTPVVTITSGMLSGEKALPGASLYSGRSYNFVSFSDNGIGFDPQFSERIFQVFQRLHGREKYEGTGIGLAICKKIVENHQGIIVASGEEGIGATFTVYLPIEK